MNSKDKRNTSYFFIPVSIGEQTSFTELVQRLESSESWLEIKEEIKYMLRYVSDKICSSGSQNRQCCHYRLNDADGKYKQQYLTDKHSYQGSKVAFGFQLVEAELYCFKTGICILALQTSFDNSDYLSVASAQYYMKKVARERIWAQSSDAEETTLLDLAKSMLSGINTENSFNYFYFSNLGEERANVFTYLEVPAQESYKHELFYLRKCFNDQFPYLENEQLESEEIYRSSHSITWGISPEAAACLACKDNSDGEFVENRFYHNFHTQYLFMYVLLLHQKYVLYYFLANVGTGVNDGSYNELDKLEEYRQKLYEFERDFVYSWVTEVPQYQMLYNRLMQAFALKQMYEDVHEPLLSLSELRREMSEKLKKEREEDINRILFILSVLGIFSALIDGFDFIASFCSWFMTKLGVQILQVSLIIVILLIGVYVFGILIDHNKDK